MSHVMLDMKQMEVLDTEIGIKARLKIALKTTGEKERDFARLEAVVGEDYKVEDIFMPFASNHFTQHENGRDGLFTYFGRMGSEHWKPEILVDIVCHALPSDGSILNLGAFTYYSASGQRGVDTSLSVRSPLDSTVNLDVRGELLGAWRDNPSQGWIYSHRLEFALPVDTVRSWTVTFSVPLGVQMFKAPWADCTHDIKTGRIELTQPLRKVNAQGKKSELVVDFQLFFPSPIYNPGLENLADFQGYCIP